MRMYQLRIDLLSDMCVSDGRGYNSNLDIDVCYDRYGFPYIPGKRIKGCLRECALELQDWGKEIPIEKIFGEEGSRKGAVTIQSAYIEDYFKWKRQVEKHSDSILFHPQNVLSHYSYIRTQTGINYETGVAKEGTLRTMRVINRGLVFVSEIELDPAYESIFHEIVSVFQHMGVSRTRGVGEVKAVLVPVENTGDNRTAVDMTAVEREIEKNGCLRYSVYLEDPVVCKSVDGGETFSLDYIQGSQILGIVLQEIREKGESEEEFLAGWEKLFFSNAYLEADGKRLLETPGTLYSIKNNDTEYVNKAVENTENRKQTEKFQLNPMKHCYVRIKEDGSLIKRSVALEERYHHRRPEDKSVGSVAVNGTESGIFYHLSSIAAGQSFQGYVRGTREQLRKVAQCLTNHSYYSIGASRSSEYGKVKITLLLDNETRHSICEDEGEKKEQGMDLQIKLESPAIVYGRENISYSTDVKDLYDEVNIVLGLKNEPDRIENFVNYTSVGGFNITWNKRKPTVDAFDKGSVFIYHFNQRPSLSLELRENESKTVVIGERTLEGYGEVSVCVLTPKTAYMGEIESEHFIRRNSVEFDISESEIASEICEDLWKEYIQIRAVTKAKSYDRKRILKAKSTVSNMLMMCEEQVTWVGIKDSVVNRYEKNSETKTEKKKIAEEIIEVVEKEMDVLTKDFQAHYRICEWEMDRDFSLLEFLKKYLTELKYRARRIESERGEARNES